jgi:hypothetical protein
MSVQQLEQQLSNAQELIDRKNRALRLANNADFRVLFQEEYFLKEAARMVQLSGDPSLTAEQRADALAMAQATGHTKRYLSMIVQQATVAERDMPELEEALAEARLEEIEGEDSPVEAETRGDLA